MFTHYMNVEKEMKGWTKTISIGYLGGSGAGGGNIPTPNQI